MFQDWNRLLLGSEQHGRRQQIALREMCGKLVTETLQIPGCASTNEVEYSEDYEEDTGYCKRDYDLYIPTTVCDKESYRGTNILPLVFAVHCYGCHSNVMHYMTDYAENNNFILVIPHGIDGSFNAQQCCGTAMEENVDDVRFFESLIHDMAHRWRGHLVSPKLVYGFGWSNGGYMVVNSARLFRAIAPVSGYQVYDNPATGLSDLVNQVSQRPIGLFLHHSEDDQSVAITGCCTDPTMAECCCGLSNYVDQCQSATDFVEAFGRTVNHCKGNPTKLLEKVFGHERAQVTCYEAGSNCLANTTYCIHNHRGHFNKKQFGNAFPMTQEVSDFFSKDACETVGGGSWSSEERYCRCDESAGNSLPYCLGHGWTERFQEPDWAHQSDGGGVTNTGALALSFVIILAFLGMFVMAREERKYRQFRAVSTFELSDFTVDPHLDDDDTFDFRPRPIVSLRPTLSKHI